MEKISVFLSYNNSDRDLVEVIAKKLKEQPDIEPWFDKWNILPGDDWQEGVEIAIRKSQVCLIFIGVNGVGPWQKEETREAIKLRVELSDESYRVIPVLLPGAKRDERGKLPSFLLRSQWAEFEESIKEPKVFDYLLAGIRNEKVSYKELNSSIKRQECPYRGLDFFDVEHAPFFFGRESLIDWLIHEIKNTNSLKERNRFLAIIGASGSGKSSLARAGLLSELKNNRIIDSARWHQVILFPGDHPLENLALELAAQGIINPNQESVENFINKSQLDERFLHKTIKLFTHLNPEKSKVLILIDQFEEVFTSFGIDKSIKGFIKNIVYASTIFNGNTIIVLTMRSDFYGNCTKYDSLSALVSDHNILVGPLNSKELQSAIEMPANAFGVRFENGLVDLLAVDASNFGVLPLLQDTLHALWYKKQDDLILLKSYINSGGLSGALNRRADKLLNSLSEKEYNTCKQLFLRMIKPVKESTGNKKYVKLRVKVNDIINSNQDKEISLKLIKKLSSKDYRLITTYGELDSPNLFYIEIIHETLIENWRKLHLWLEENNSIQIAYHRFIEIAEEWKEKNRDENYLYKGSRLEEIQSLKEGFRLNENELAFINDSEILRRKELEFNRRKVRRKIFTSLFVAIASLFFCGVIYWQYSDAKMEANISEARRLSNLSIEKSNEKDFTSAFLLAKEVDKKIGKYDPALVNKTYINAFYNASSNPFFLCTKNFNQHANEVNGAIFSPNGKYILSYSKDSTAKIWNLDGTLLANLDKHNGDVDLGVFSPNGHSVLTVSRDTTIKIWSLEGRLLANIDDYTGKIHSAVFSPNGQFILSRSEDKVAKLWDLQGNQIANLNEQNEPIWSAFFSNKGQYIITTSRDKVRKWSIEGELLTTIIPKYKSRVRAIVSPDGQYILTYSSEKVISIWDKSGKILANIFIKDFNIEFLTCKFSPDSQYIIITSWDQNAQLWNLKGEQILNLNTESDRVRTLFSPDGQYIVTYSSDGLAKLWDLKGKLITNFDHLGESIKTIELSSNSKLILTHTRENSIRLWNIKGELLTRIDKHTKDITKAVFSPDGKHILSSSKDNTVKLWNLRYGIFTNINAHTDEITFATFSSNGQFILTSSADKTVKLWDTKEKTLKNLDSYTQVTTASFFNNDQYILAYSNKDLDIFNLNGILKREIPQQRRISNALVSPTGDKILTLYVGPKIHQVHDSMYLDNNKLPWIMAKLWDTEGTHVSDLKEYFSKEEIESHGTWFNFYCTFSPDGKYIITRFKPNTADLWDSKGNEIAKLEGHTDRIRLLKFSPDGEYILTCSNDKTVKLWNLKGKLLADMKCYSPLKGVTNNILPSYGEFFPDGQSILTTSGDKSIELWDLNGKLLDTLRFNEPVLGIYISPNGAKILAVLKSRKAKLLSKSGKLISNFKDAPVFGYSKFSSDGKYILTSSKDKSAHLFDSNGRLLMNLNKQKGQIKSIDFSPDGKYILTNSNDNTVMIWPMMSEIKAWINDDPILPFTEEERLKYNIIFDKD